MKRAYRDLRRNACALFVLLVGLPMAVLSAHQTVAEELKPSMVTYKQTEDSDGKEVELRLHVFMKEQEEGAAKRPAIVFFFGGGWVGGTPQQFYPHCQDLAGRGMVAIAAEYRVRGKHGTPPQACVEDGKSAIRYVRKIAKALNVDTNRIVAAGGSAGGHVAACTGIIKGFEAEGEDKEISSKPNLMILFNPVLDTSPKNGYGASKVAGGDPLVISPLHHVHKEQPPSLIFHGDADKTVKIDSIRSFEEKSKKLGAQSKLLEYEGAGHGFFNHAKFRKQKEGAPNYYELTMEQAVKFLAKHGYVNGTAD